MARIESFSSAMAKMMEFGAFKLIAPLALLALFGVPIIIWLSRFIPRPPNKTKFAGVFILQKLRKTPKVSKIAPIWLKILRALMAFALIVACAMPIIDNVKLQNGQSNFLIVIDDDIANANEMAQIKRELKDLLNIESAKSAQSSAILQICSRQIPNTPLNLANIIGQIEKLEASQTQCNRADLAKNIDKLGQKYKILYFSNNIESPSDNVFFDTLKRHSIGEITIRKPQIEFAAITNAIFEKNGISVTMVGDQSAKLNIFDQNSQIIASLKPQNGGFIELVPNKLRAARYVKIDGQNNAAALFILDKLDQRPLLIAPKAEAQDQPLLSDAHFINSAILTLGDLKTYDNGQDFETANAIIFGDTAGFDEGETAKLLKYAQNGGTIIRFLGPKSLNKEDSPLFTAPINLEPHIISSGFAVENIGISPFTKDSIFADIALPEKLNINQSILFKSANNEAKILISLNDGAPLLSMREIGSGKLYMFHTSAAPIWSDIGLSNLQLAFLKQIIRQSTAKSISASSIEPNIPLRPSLIVDPYGNIIDKIGNSKPIITPVGANTKVDENHAAGIYEGNGAIFILNAGAQIENIAPQKLPSHSVFGENQKSFALFSWILMIGFIAFLIDNLLMNLPHLGKKAAAFSLFLGLSVFLAPNAKAQNLDLNGGDDLKLSYILTNDNVTNEQAKSGLVALAETLRRRTNVEPSGVIGLDAQKDELAKQPIIYWLLPKAGQSLSPQAVQNLNKYMQNGGILFIDTRGLGMDAKRAQDILKLAVNGLKIPPLEKVGNNHVLTRSFYILANFPGFYSNGSLWVQSQAATIASANDGVSPIIISNGDLARAWASTKQPDEFDAITGDFANEIPMRVGINIYLYALMGQYKADQVHVRALLDRFGVKRK